MLSPASCGLSRWARVLPARQFGEAAAARVRGGEGDQGQLGAQVRIAGGTGPAAEAEQSRCQLARRRLSGGGLGVTPPIPQITTGCQPKSGLSEPAANCGRHRLSVVMSLIAYSAVALPRHELSAVAIWRQPRAPGQADGPSWRWPGCAGSVEARDGCRFEDGAEEAAGPKAVLRAAAGTDPDRPGSVPGWRPGTDALSAPVPALTGGQTRRSYP